MIYRYYRAAVASPCDVDAGGKRVGGSPVQAALGPAIWAADKGAWSVTQVWRPFKKELLRTHEVQNLEDAVPTRHSGRWSHRGKRHLGGLNNEYARISFPVGITRFTGGRKMKTVIIAAAVSAAVLFVVIPARAECTHCVIQTKAPSASAPGKFDYRVSCLIDLSGDEVNTSVTAANDAEAVEMVRQKQC
jgi:hypothetical protein